MNKFQISNVNQHNDTKRANICIMKNKVFGMLYDYEGITATSSQFYLTDSVEHFFRGSFYFNTEINDSIAPINNFVKEDVRFLIESFRWK